MAGRTFLASWQLSATRSHACAMWLRVARAPWSPNVRAISKHRRARRRYSSALFATIPLPVRQPLQTRPTGFGFNLGHRSANGRRFALDGTRRNRPVRANRKPAGAFSGPGRYARRTSLYDIGTNMTCGYCPQVKDRFDSYPPHLGPIEHLPPCHSASKTRVNALLAFHTSTYSMMASSVSMRRSPIHSEISRKSPKFLQASHCGRG
jgi:hypothetical protein